MKFQSQSVVRGAMLSLVLVPTLLSAQGRSEADVHQIAQRHFANVLSSPTRGVAQIEYIPSSAFVQTHSGEEAFYLCNLPEAGYVLVSTNTNLPEVIGYSASPYQSDKELPAGLISLMQSYVDLKDGFNAMVPLSAQASVAPLLSTKWNQDTPFNGMCPLDGYTRSMVGCVATAAAQVMKYYRWPEKKGTGKISYVTPSRKIPVSVDLSDYSFAWDLMLDEYQPNQYSNAEGNAVAKLMYAVGAACQMDYTYAESGSTLIDAAQGLSQYFGYDKDMYLLFGDVLPAAAWNEILVNEINQSRPVMFSGAASNGEGHAFVLDGYDSQGGNVYYHVNWGWGGSSDGYFLVSNLNPDETGIGGGSGAYNTTQLILLNCQPDDGKANPRYGQVEAITVSKNSFSSGEEILFDLDLDNVFGIFTSDFSGAMQFSIVNASGQTVQELTVEGIDIPVDEGLVGTLSSFSVKSLPDGIYYIKMCLKSKDGQTIECIPYQPWPKFIVGNVEDGIDSIGQDTESPTVHSLMGTQIKAAGIQTLPAGFYVIDNQKVIIR